MELWYDLGQGAVTIISTTVLSLNEWHSIEVSRSGRDGELTVDGTPSVTGRSPGFFTMLQISSDLYVGVAPTPLTLPFQLRALNGFHGCMRQLRTARFSDPPVDLIADARSGQGVTECPSLDLCSSFTCLNGGTCMNTIESFACECVEGFTGETCEEDLCLTSSPCQNNGVCYKDSSRTGLDTLQCNCSAPFTGQNCTESKLLWVVPLYHTHRVN